jgi:hypothetical protein
VSVAVGCGADPSGALPVRGRVTVDGEPLRANSATVTYVPDADRGNTATIMPTGNVDQDGHYVLYYAPGKKGALPGWYRVQVVAAQVGPGTRMPGAPNVAPPPPPLFDSKFRSPTTSGLEVEVVETPPTGAYDLQLTK